MKLSGRTQINLDSSSFLKLYLQTRHGQQAGARRGVNEQVQIAALLVVAVQHRPEDARIRHARFKHKLADRLPMLWQNLRRPHVNLLPRLIPVYRQLQQSAGKSFESSDDIGPSISCGERFLSSAEP